MCGPGESASAGLPKGSNYEKAITTHFQFATVKPEVDCNSFFSSFGDLGSCAEAFTRLPAPPGAQL